MKKHTIEINLDDIQETKEFIQKNGTLKGRALAKKLGLSGEGSAKLASAFSNYAWNKNTAIDCRKNGNINSALKYEEICDSIYKENIQPNCKCW